MRKLRVHLALGAAALVALAAVGGSYAVGSNGGKGAHARAFLTGYQETPSISTTGYGDFEARVEDDTIEYRLRVRRLEGGNTLAAHIHFAERHVAGAVVAFLCGGGGKPACPNGSGDVEGTLTAADVGVTPGSVAQGIAAGEFAELVRAMRAGATYVNVHTARWPAGEIRGQIYTRGGGHGKRD